jgi:hypothetical protein
LLELIGVGGMGAVWKAHHLALDVPVALKLMLPIQDLDPHAGERLLREARAAARLRHPNIVGVLNVGEEAGLPFLVMELVEGGSLQDLLDQRGSLPIGEVLGLALQILNALELTAEHGIVHRDIKPDNILIDPRGTAKLADLGLAKQVGAELSLTQTGAVMGSPYYIAPEQAANAKAADPRADIYSLGCVLYHMLAGTPPYTGATHIEVILKHINGPVADLSTLASDVPSGLVAVIRKMMARTPAERYQTPQEVRAALQPFITPAGAADILPDAVPGKVSPWFSPSSRRRLLWGLGIACLLLLIALAVLALRGSPPTQPSPTRPSSQVPVPGSGAPESLPQTAHAQDLTNPPAGPRQRSRRRSDRQPSRGFAAASADDPPAYVAQAALPAQGTAALYDALSARDGNRLRQLLDRGTSPNVGDGVTSPLHQAVHLGQAQSVRLLLEKGANPNTRDEEGDMPLHDALRRGERAAVAALLDFGANPNVRDRMGRSPLDLASGDEDLTRRLREKGANR